MVDAAKAIQDFIYTRTYARWVPELNRRETWPETVSRYVTWLLKDQPLKKDSIEAIHTSLYSAILSQHVVPSMRAIWSAGRAADKDNTAIYNCSFLVLDSITSFKELFYILMCGTGVGFSCEEQYVSKLPRLAPRDCYPIPAYYQIPDTREGWSDALDFVLTNEFLGRPYSVDYSQIRPAGQRLNTFGGYSSGPEPLIKLLSNIHVLFDNKRNFNELTITPLEAHDIACMVAEAVVVGGVRRSSLISLSDLDNNELKNAKHWPFPQYRGMSNNSAVFTGTETYQDFQSEWDNLVQSGTGERGIFNRSTAFRKSGRFFADSIGVNPCAEIILRGNQFCNLSEAVCRSYDTAEGIRRKVELATVIGILQANKTYFPYLRKSWQDNCEEERLLGVSITGQYDNIDLFTPENLDYWRRSAELIACNYANQMGINTPTAITCTKPSGTVSQLVDASSGAHPRYAEHYIRRYRISDNDPLLALMRDSGFNIIVDNVSADTSVVEFPMASPRGAVTRHDISSFDQFRHYIKMQQYWAEHNTSMTIYVSPDEWEQLGHEVWKHRNDVVAVSFLPKEDENHHYELAPYEEISYSQYNLMLDKLPQIDYTELTKYEQTDHTIGEREFACIGDRCEIA